MAYSFGKKSGGAFGLETALDALGWSLVRTSPEGDSSSVVAKSVEHGVPTDGTGEYLPDAERTFNQITQLQDEYVSKDNAAQHSMSDIIDAVKSLIGAATAKAITEIEITTTNTGDQRARLILRGHEHGAGSSGFNHTVNSTIPDISSAVADLSFDGYGATDFIGCGFGTYDMTSGGISIRIGHVDKQGGKGDFLAGRSQGVQIDANTVAISDVAPATTTQADGTQVIGTNTLGEYNYTFDSAVRDRPGNDFGQWTVRAHAYLPASVVT